MKIRPPLAHVAFWSAMAFLIALVEVAVRMRVISPAAVAAPSEVLVASLRLFTKEGFLRDVMATLSRAALGFAVGFLGGAVAALCLLFAGRARSSGEFTLDFLRSIPVTAVIPLFITAFGIGEATKVAIGATAALFTAAITIWIGIRRAQSRQARILFLYRPAVSRMLLHVIIPEALPAIIAAARVALSAAFVLIIVAEMFLGTHAGIGFVINNKSYGDDRPGQYAAVFVAGLLGYLLNLCLRRVELMTVRWTGVPAQGALL